MRKLLKIAGLALALQGCSGLYLSIPDESGGRDVDIAVTAITPELVTQHASVRPAPPSALTSPTEPWVYRIGPGDVLDISIPSIANVPAGVSGVYSLREPDRGYPVAPDGTLYLPYVGPVPVQGASLRQVQERVVEQLQRYIKNPQVVVTLREFRSQKVLVAGQVPRPGYLPITDVPLTLLGALSAAGSTPQLRSDLVARPLTAAQLQPHVESGDYRRVQVTRGGKAETVDVLALLRAGDPRLDPLLLDGDAIYVAPVERSYVYVLGEVRQQALIEIVEHRTSLAEVLLASGGLSQQSAKATRVYVIRGELAKPRVFQLDAKEADALLLADAFELQPRDVVYVAEANISRWNRFLAQLVPTIQTLLSGGIFANTVGE